MELLLNTLKWSAIVGAVVLVLWLLKPRMDRRYSPKWRYWAWLGLAAALLLAPVPWGKLLPEETAVTAPVVVVEVPYYQVTVGDMTGVRAQSYRDGDDPREVMPPNRGEVGLFGSSSREELETAYRTTGVVIKAETVLTALWLLGAAGFLLYHVLGSAAFLRRQRRWSMPPAAELRERYEALACETGLKRPPELRICSRVGSPMVAGLFRPTLLLPRHTAEAAELPFILRHELTHYRRRDLWYKFLLLAANALHWFNPLVYLMRRAASSDLELTCDETVMAGADAATRRSYGEALLSAVHREKGLERAALSTHFYGGAAAMRDRLWNLLGSGVRKRGALVLTVALVLTLLAACAVQVSQTKPPVEDPLTEEELAQWQEKLSSRELNGFVTRLYTDVRYLPLGELFYNYMDEQADGTVLSHVPENADAIYEETFGDVPDCPYTGITRTLANEFLMEYTGYTVEDFRGGFGSLWTYNGKEDGWFCAHGDTNRCQVEVLSGTKLGDTVTLELALDGGSEPAGTMTIVDGKIRSFTNPLYSAVEAMAWNMVDTAARSIETSDWIHPAEGGTVPEGTRILDSYISSLSGAEVCEAGGKTWSVWCLAYRLKPEDMSTVVFAGGMDAENGWITESSSMGSPVFIVSVDGDGTVKLEETTHTGTIGEEGWTWEEYIVCHLVLGMDIYTGRLGGWPELNTPFILDLENGHNTWALDWQDTAHTYLAQAGYQTVDRLAVTREFNCTNAEICDQSMLVEADCGGDTVTLFMSYVHYHTVSYWEIGGVLWSNGANNIQDAGDNNPLHTAAFQGKRPGTVYLYGKANDRTCGIRQVDVAWSDGSGGTSIETAPAIRAYWGADSKEIYTECWDETGSLVLEDFNFDGYVDIGLQAWISASNLPRYLWLYQPETGDFQYALCVNGDLTLDPEARTLTAANVDQAGAVQYREHYRPDGAGTLYLTQRDTLRYENGQYVPQVSEIYDREGNVIASGDGRISARAVYRQALEGVLEDWKTSFPDEDLSKNHFAIWDVDGDGREELILEHSSAAVMAGLSTEICGYVDGEWVTQLSEFPDLTFYGSGAVTAGWSHNQGMAGDSFWPYTLYQYDPASDTYIRVGMVDAWDKALRDTDYDGTPFPDDVDADGDGIVYYIMTGGMYERKDPVDGPDHQAWLESYTAGTQPMEIPYQALTAENIAGVK